MKLFFLIGFICLNFHQVEGQRSSNKFENFIIKPGIRNNVIPIHLEESENAELVAISLKWKSDKSDKIPEFSMDFKLDDNSRGNKTKFEIETHLETDGSWGTCLPIYLPKGTKEIFIIPANFSTQIDLTVNIFTIHENNSQLQESEMSELANCFCDTLVYRSRSQWECPDPPRTYSYTDVTHLIVHHAAGPNTANNWASVVLSIWNFHVNTNGFADIGYNWLIDPNGVLYEGRGGGNNVIGAHFCAKNSKTMGVCMLGNLSTAEPTEAALNTLRKLLFWKSCDVAISPEGQNLHAGTQINNISGHRDGCATECPGNFMYPKLSALRSLVQASIDACSTTNIVEDTQDSYFSPNPVKEKLLLSADIVWVKIFDLSGRLELYTSHLPNKILDLTAVNAGNYFIQTLDDKGIFKTGKLVVID
jgi:hypothetical protein